jgi:hypothetical protein
VTWRQFQLGLTAVFLGNAAFTVLVVVAVTRQAGPNHTTNTQSVIIVQDKAELIETLAREKLNAGL